MTAVIRIKLTPKASKNAVNGRMRDENGNSMLKISVTAVPENGKANEAMIEILAKTVGVAKSSFTLLSGATNRIKTLAFDGEEEYLQSKLPPEPEQ